AYLAGPGARPTAWDEPAAAIWPSNWEEHLSLVRYTASLRLWRLGDLDLSADYCFESAEEEAAYETALRERMEVDSKGDFSLYSITLCLHCTWASQ
uniref:SHQ1 domain-containing protein n=1 Tax=Macrostomum lignano TaxID=282301 RepID=A0A1I8HBV1_9PLAT